MRVRAPIKETQKQFIEESKYFSSNPEPSNNIPFTSTNGAKDNKKNSVINGLSSLKGDKSQNGRKSEDSHNMLKSVTYYGNEIVSINGFKSNINLKGNKTKGLLYTIIICYINLSGHKYVIFH